MSNLYRAGFTLEQVALGVDHELVDIAFTGDTIDDVMRQMLEHVDAVYRRHRPTITATNEAGAGLLTAVTVNRRRDPNPVDGILSDLHRYFMNSPVPHRLRTGGIVGATAEAAAQAGVAAHCHRPLNDGNSCHEPAGHDGDCDQLAAARRANRGTQANAAPHPAAAGVTVPDDLLGDSGVSEMAIAEAGRLVDAKPVPKLAAGGIVEPAAGLITALNPETARPRLGQLRHYDELGAEEPPPPAVRHNAV